jgi:hypothetical protein
VNKFVFAFVFAVLLIFSATKTTVSKNTSTLKITAYAPDSGDGISGSGTMASNVVPFFGAAACPIRIPFGTKIELTGRAKLRAEALRLPVQMVCMDRFRNLSREGIDIAIPLNFAGLNHAQRIELARVFGVVLDHPIVSPDSGVITYSEKINEK